MTVRDFMNYLIYVEHDAENLQFYLWYKDYVKRFTALGARDAALAPEWTRPMQDDTVAKIRKDNFESRKTEPAAAEIFKGADFEKNVQPEMRGPDTNGVNPFNTPPRTPNQSNDQESILSASHAPSTHASTYKSQAADAFQSADVRLPCEYTRNGFGLRKQTTN